MSDANFPTSKSSANWRIYIILTLLLFVLPGLSWIYLSGGYNWRKEALSELGVYGKIRSAPVIYPDGTRIDQVAGKICVVHVFGEEPDLTPENLRILDTNEKLFEQFKESPYFRLVMITEGGTAEFVSAMQTKNSADHACSVYTGGVQSWSTTLNNGYETYIAQSGARPAKTWYALADTAGTIRRYYDAMSDEEMDRMVQQIAILLPK